MAKHKPQVGTAALYVRVPVALKKRIDDAAGDREMTLSMFVGMLLSEAMDELAEPVRVFRLMKAKGE